MNSIQAMVFVDNKGELHPVAEEFAPICYYLNTFLSWPPSVLRHFTEIFERQGLRFEDVYCDSYSAVDDPDDEPFDVCFSIAYEASPAGETTFVSWEQFYDLMRLAAKTHLERHPEDEAKLRQIFEAKGIAFDQVDTGHSDGA